MTFEGQPLMYRAKKHWVIIMEHAKPILGVPLDLLIAFSIICGNRVLPHSRNNVIGLPTILSKVRRLINAIR
jgi:hypothetical protein